MTEGAAEAGGLSHGVKVVVTHPGWFRLLLPELARRPGGVRRVPTWLRQLEASPFTLRIPWWTYDAADAVAARLPPGATVFEYGSGGSTLWLEDRGARVTSVEHHPKWYERMVAAVGPSTVVQLAEPSPTGTRRSEVVARGFFDGYIDTIAGFDDGSFDLVIVDGRCRVACAAAAAPKVRAGGMLLLDDTERDRYRPALDALASWSPVTYAGLKPSGFSRTTVFTRPA